MAGAQPAIAALLLGTLCVPAHAVVDESTTRQVAQGLARLDPWIPALLLVWIVLGAWSWHAVTRPLRARQQLRQQMGADAPQTVAPSPWPLRLAALSTLLLALLSWVVADASHAGHAPVDAWDRAAQSWSQTHVSPWLRQGLHHLTDTGDVLWLGLLATGVALVLALRQRWLALQVWVFAIGLNGLVTRVMKNGMDRARPEALYALVTSGASFPSGHTAGSIIVYGLLWQVVRGRVPARWRPWVALGLMALVVSIAISRVLLEAHFASDVAAGALLGVAILGLAVWALQRGQALQ